MRLIPRLWPRSLVGQLLLAAAAALLIAQAINLTLLIYAQREERLSAIAGAAAAQIADAADRVEQGLPIEARGLRVRRGGRGGDVDRAQDSQRPRRVSLGARPRFRDDMVAWPALAQRVASNLDDAGIAVRDVRAGRAPAAGGVRRRDDQRQLIAVAAQIRDGRWVTVRARARAQPPRVAGFLVGQTMILFALLLVPLTVLAWRVARPLRMLTAAAVDARPGKDIAPVDETGPSDVRALIAAFNQMRGRLITMVNDKDRMIGAIGHDLRTPLASLRVRVEQVEDARLRDKMIASIDDMALMLADILSLARAGQPVERPHLTRIDGLVRDVADDYAARGQPVTCATMLAECEIMIRPAALRRVLVNLIDNAISYGGSAMLTMAVDGDDLCVTVADDGPGIAEDRIAAMMEPFVRAEESRNRNTGGSGLGLALARAAVQAEGGTLTLANRTSGGLVATIRLPLAVATDNQT